jgi:hypothetical protein
MPYRPRRKNIVRYGSDTGRIQERLENRQSLESMAWRPTIRSRHVKTQQNFKSQLVQEMTRLPGQKAAVGREGKSDVPE